ncbi:SGNH/GDSL hydrolase family protein [Streptomyces sp. NPDC059578]|uniref:SGNH/GDSL hydrolase family protein n=1 Tax=Streptomyces sp. NPDC059578 TaxID=3346874 RepID=UPI0036D00926
MRRSRLAACTAAFTSLLVAAGLTLTGAAAAQAAPRAAATGYVALGDSYSSGLGAGAYEGASGSCKRTPRAYPALWAAANSPSSFHFTACSGARTGDVRTKQLGPLGSGTGLVSITVGGNDAGFSDVMSTCVTESEKSCLDRIATARRYVDSTLPGHLDELYEAIADRAPRAEVVVLGYPRFYKLSGSCIAGLSERERSAINSASDHLNGALAKRAADHGFTFAGVTGRFAGHEICSGDAWLHSLKLLSISESYHPKAAGQSRGYLPALNSAA